MFNKNKKMVLKQYLLVVNCDVFYRPINGAKL
jgi:hypothetical protein